MHYVIVIVESKCSVDTERAAMESPLEERRGNVWKVEVISLVSPQEEAASPASTAAFCPTILLLHMERISLVRPRGGCESIEYSTICEFSATFGEFHKYLLRSNSFHKASLLKGGGDTSAVGDHHLVGKTSEGGCESTESAFCPRFSSAAPYGIHFVVRPQEEAANPSSTASF